MNWARFTRIRVYFWIAVLILTMVLWVAALVGSFIGDTAFIGHISMLALVLAAGSALEASLPSLGDHH